MLADTELKQAVIEKLNEVVQGVARALSLETIPDVKSQVEENWEYKSGTIALEEIDPAIGIGWNLVREPTVHRPLVAWVSEDEPLYELETQERDAFTAVLKTAGVLE